jgi:tRNA modification GTPase
VASPLRCEQGRLTDTIFAVSSGRPPAAIAVIRVSGPQAFAAAEALAGPLPAARTATLRNLRRNGASLDSALLLCFPGPRSATGEDLVELHCHGGRAVIAAVEDALAMQPGLRRAEPGEYTRRALANGRIDLMQAEGLADLLQAETEAQRLSALAATEGRLSARTAAWLNTITMLSARVEAMLDYADSDDVEDDAEMLAGIADDMMALRREIERALEAPSVERLRDGVRIVICGPPNAGKSTLLNLLAERDAAIVSPVAGTTRDRVEASVLRAGLPLVLIDTAGLTETDDPIEAIGVERARSAMSAADLLVWLGDDRPPRGAVWVHARSDLPGRQAAPHHADVVVSANDPGSIARLWDLLSTRAGERLGTGDMPAMRETQRDACAKAAEHLDVGTSNALLIAEGLAGARRMLSRMLGLDASEVMLDALFSRFCLGK